MNIIQMPSPSFDGRGGQLPSIILLHYTGMNSAEEALDRLTDKTSQVSSHYTIDEDGKIYQHVDEGKRAWHAGKACWQGERNINAVSIGIEIVNPGHEFGYREFPNAQIKTVIALCREIQQRHNIVSVLAHSDVAPDRKQDPGELFPWQNLACENIGVWPEVSDDGLVKGAGINVEQSLRDVGYEALNVESMLIAFQRHYVPEVFDNGTEGQACGLTKGRLYVLIAGND